MCCRSRCTCRSEASACDLKLLDEGHIQLGVNRRNVAGAFVVRRRIETCARDDQRVKVGLPISRNFSWRYSAPTAMAAGRPACEPVANSRLACAVQRIDLPLAVNNSALRQRRCASSAAPAAVWVAERIDGTSSGRPWRDDRAIGVAAGEFVSQLVLVVGECRSCSPSPQLRLPARRGSAAAYCRFCPGWPPLSVSRQRT